MPSTPENAPVESTQLGPEASKRCEQAVRDYGEGRLTKGAAASRIYEALSTAGFEVDESQLEGAFDSYIQLLDQHDRTLKAAAERGERIAATEQRECTAANAGNSHTASEEPNDVRESRKRGREESPEGTTTLLRKQAPNENLYAWSNRIQLGGILLSPNLELTRKLVLNYGTDLKNAKLHLLSTPGVPRFPDAEWSNLLLGRAVNLDAVLSGAYSTVNDSQSIEQLGDLEIRFGNTKPVKSVRTAGDWIFAWQRTVAASHFAFPHRGPELARYTEYILSLFSSKRTESHGRIIDMDKAIRRFIGESNDVELSDSSAFKQFESSFLDADGIYHDGDRSRGKSRRKGDWRSEDPCRHFNEGRCNRSGCRFRHVCQICGGDHQKGDHEKAKGAPRS